MIDTAEIDAYLHPLTPLPSGMTAGGALRRPIRAVLFDIYGTLFISGSGDLGTARRQARRADIAAVAEKYGLSAPPQELADAFVNRIEAEHRQKTAQGIEAPEVEYDRIWMAAAGIKNRRTARRFAAAYELVANPVWPMPGAEQTLAGLRAQGLSMGIVSNAQFFTPWLFTWFFDRSPDALGFKKDLQIYSFQLGCAKPSPVLFDTAARRLAERGIDAGAALFVGNDMRNDVAAAQKAGFQTALFAGDARSLRLREEMPECRSIQPDLVVTELPQLLDLQKPADKNREPE